MAFLTQSDIFDRLPSGADNALVDDLLAQIESELANLGLTFIGFTTATRQIHADIQGQSIFDIEPFASLSSVKIKNFTSDYEEVLIIGRDYRIMEHSYVANIFIRLDLVPRQRYSLRDPQYLELVGSWGYMSSVPADLRAAIIRYILSQLEFKDLNYRAITKSKTGDSEITYADHSSEYVSSIIQYQPFASVLSKYLL